MKNLEWLERLERPESRIDLDYHNDGTTWKLEWPASWNDLKAGMTCKLERPESWIDLKAGTTWKLEWSASWNDLTGMTCKLERPESWNDLQAGTTRKLERPESWNDLKAGMTCKLDRPESWNDLQARTTWKLERPDWNDLQTRMTWKLEWSKSWKTRIDWNVFRTTSVRLRNTVQFFFIIYSDSAAFIIIAYSRNGVKGTFVCIVDKNIRKEKEEGQSLFCCCGGVPSVFAVFPTLTVTWPIIPHPWMKEEKGIRHWGEGVYLRCPVSTSVQFSLHNEGSSEYICVCEEREILRPNF